jgi:hypothetical protein
LVLGVAQRHHRFTGLDCGGVADRDRAQARGTLQPDQRDVARLVVADDSGRVGLAGGDRSDMRAAKMGDLFKIIFGDCGLTVSVSAPPVTQTWIPPAQ